MEERRWRIPEKASLLILYLVMVVCGIVVTGMVAPPLEEAVQPTRLSPDVKIGGLSLGELEVEQARQRVAALIHAAQAKPLVLEYDGQTWTLTPEQLGLVYDLEGTTSELLQKSTATQGLRKLWHTWTGEPVNPVVELRYTWKPEEAVRALEQIKAAIDQQPANAVIRIDGTQVRVIPHRTGRTLSIDETLKRMELSLHSLEADRRIPLAVQEKEPAVVGTRLEMIDTLLAEASTALPAQIATDRQNIKKIVSRLNGQVIDSHAVFSFLQTIGPFVQGGTYVTGTDAGSVQKTGGIQFGIGQAASTLYWAALKAELAIVERHPHLQPQAYVPPGLDAAIWDGKLDLKLENPFDHPVYVDARLTGGQLHIGLYGNNADRKTSSIVLEQPERFRPETVVLIDGSLAPTERRIAQEGAEGVLAKIFRVVKKEGSQQEESRQLITKDYYRPIPKLVYVGPPSQIINQGDGNLAVFDSAGQPSPPVPPQTAEGGFANDPNMVPDAARPPDIPDTVPDTARPPDIPEDPNVLIPSP
ncbi:hypothetical protein G3578_03925 [Brevibacillus sp. SYP-B805]|uniref:VanW family protein n=1 Tax=Brevibacillus sp. SYP-B805 TaxID=1578199 RepID=UPI0013EC62EF|nr:VanW family protein [Brevibacillus sp. SYP-B805]NGQ94323.1 hypothetical protein [Brevibacillus sp. SYP-B805]